MTTAADDTRKDEQFEKSLKRVRTRNIPRENLGLTCNEANVDSILSEGESI
jgi:hypothetical protein